MTAKAYVAAADVAAFLGKTFTAGQNTQADALAEAATAFVDRYTGRAWAVTSPVVDEDHFALDGPNLWLRQTPITAITSLTRSYGPSESSPTVLVAGTDYELQDVATGRLWIRNWVGFDWFGNDPVGYASAFGLGQVRYRVTYTVPAAVPADIALATKMLVASWMRPVLDGIGPGIAGYSISGDISVQYQSAIEKDGIPSEVKALLKGRRRLVFA